MRLMVCSMGWGALLRQGEISPTLVQLRHCWYVSRDMEKQCRGRKIDLMRPDGDPRRARALYCVGQQEAFLDAGYELIEDMRPSAGNLAADIMTAHFLECEDWHDLSARLGIPYDKCKKVAYRAICRYDAQNEGRPQGV